MVVHAALCLLEYGSKNNQAYFRVVGDLGISECDDYDHLWSAASCY